MREHDRARPRRGHDNRCRVLTKVHEHEHVAVETAVHDGDGCVKRRAHRGVADPCAARPHSIEAPDGTGGRLNGSNRRHRASPTTTGRKPVAGSPVVGFTSAREQSAKVVLIVGPLARENPYQRIATTTMVKAPPRGPIHACGEGWCGRSGTAPDRLDVITRRIGGGHFCYLTRCADGTLRGHRDVHNSTSEPVRH